jgi:hypothetical protein
MIAFSAIPARMMHVAARHDCSFSKSFPLFVNCWYAPQRNSVATISIPDTKLKKRRFRPKIAYVYDRDPKEPLHKSPARTVLE